MSGERQKGLGFLTLIRVKIFEAKAINDKFSYTQSTEIHGIFDLKNSLLFVGAG